MDTNFEDEYRLTGSERAALKRWRRPRVRSLHWLADLFVAVVVGFTFLLLFTGGPGARMPGSGSYTVYLWPAYVLPAIGVLLGLWAHRSDPDRGAGLVAFLFIFCGFSAVGLLFGTVSVTYKSSGDDDRHIELMDF